MKITMLMKLIKTSSFLFPVALSILISMNARCEELIARESIVASCKIDNLHFENFERTSEIVSIQQKNINDGLLGILTDANASSLSKCCAAYYLGEFRAPTSVNALAANIKLAFDSTQIPSSHLPVMRKMPALEALVNIGTPSIPAVIQNLAESDDDQVRKLSLEVLVRIDRDHDISRLRLQKALEADHDAADQARLKSAINALSTIPADK